MATLLIQPTPHEEAAAFLRNKPAVSRAVFDKLVPELKARAFTIAGIEGLGVLTTVRDTIATLPEGGDWETLKKQIVSDIDPFFVDPEADAETQGKQRYAAERRAELLLRTHGQQAYAAAAWREADEQRDLFPFWKYQTLGDGNVRPSHAALDGIVLPHDDPFWATHTPPWDWGCRCAFIPLSDADVAEIQDADRGKPPEQRSILDEADRKKLNDERVIYRPSNLATGTGHPVPYSVASPAERGKPNAYTFRPGDLRLDAAAIQSRHDPKDWAQFEKWAKGQKLPDQGKTVWEWMNGKADDAPAPAPPPLAPTPVVPAGPPKTFTQMRADLEQAAAKFAPQLSSLKGEMKTALASHDFAEQNRIRREITAIETAARAELHPMLALPESQRTTVAIKTFAPGDSHAAGMEFVQSVTHRDVFTGDKVDVKRIRARACADPKGAYINGRHMDVQTVAHELGHIIEARNPAALTKSVAFRGSRTAGDSPRWLGPGYKRTEITLEDEWKTRGGTHYTGKLYRSHGTSDYATEVLSTGLERLWHDPAGFIQDDPEFLEHVLNTLRNV